MEEVKKHSKGTSIGSAAPTMTTFSITVSIASSNSTTTVSSLSTTICIPRTTSTR